MPLTLMSDEKIQAAKIEDWGQNKASGWWACVVDFGDGPKVATRAPVGKFWRVEFTERGDKPGTVKRAHGDPQYVAVRFDDGTEGNCHPESLKIRR